MMTKKNSYSRSFFERPTLRRDFLRTTTALAVMAVISPAISLAATASRPIIVAGRDTPEEQILTALTLQLLNNSGFPTQHVPGLDTITLRRRLEEGTIDLYWEYTWIGLSVHNGVQERLKSQETYDATVALDSRRGLVWLDPVRANIAPTLGMRRDFAEAAGIEGIESLAEVVTKATPRALTIAIPSNFRSDAKDGFIALQRAYGFKWPSDSVVPLENRSVYEVLRSKGADVGIVQRTNPYIISYDLVALEDEREFFVPYILAPVMRQSVAQERPAMVEKLNALTKSIDDRAMRRMTTAIDINRQPVNDVAENFLKTLGLVGG